MGAVEHKLMIDTLTVSVQDKEISSIHSRTLTN